MSDWEAGARILSTTESYALTGDVRFSFSVPRGTSNAVVGLTNTESPTLPAHIAFGIQVSSGSYRITESGVAKTSWVSFGEELPRFHVQRVGSTITYSFENQGSLHPQGFALAGSLIHTSDGTIGGGVGAGVVLFSTGDLVFDGEFTGVTHATGTVTFRPLEVISREGRAEANLSFEPLALTAATEDFQTASIAFRPMTVRGSALPPADVGISFEPLRVSSRAARVYGASIDMQPLQVQANAFDESLNIAVMTSAPMQVFATEAPILADDGVSVSFEPLLLSSTGFPSFPSTVNVSFEPMDAKGYQQYHTEAFLSMEPHIVFSFASTVKTNPKFNIILSPVTHFVDTAAYVGSLAYGFSEVSMNATNAIISQADASSEWVIFRSENRVSTATASTALAHGSPHVVEATADSGVEISDRSISQPAITIALASVEVSAFTTSSRQVASTAIASTRISDQSGDEYEASATATTEVRFRSPQRVEALATAGTEVDEVVQAGSTKAESLALASTELEHLRTNTIEVVSTASARTEILHYEPSAVAWVMNTHTAAVSWYSNYQFLDMVQVGDRVLAVGPEGLSALGGDTDNDIPIQAHIDFGFKQYEVLDAYSNGRSDVKKRVDSFWFGYRATQPLEITVETYGQGLPIYQYEMPDTPADQPRNNRIRPGKKLAARYWRVSVYNSNGGSFRVDDMSADIYEMGRRL